MEIYSVLHPEAEASCSTCFAQGDIDALFAQRAERLAAETRRCDGKHDGQFYYSFHRFYTFLCEERADAGAGDRPVQTEIRSLQRWCKSRTASDAIRTTGRAAASARGLPPLQR